MQLRDGRDATTRWSAPTDDSGAFAGRHGVALAATASAAPNGRASVPYRPGRSIVQEGMRAGTAAAAGVALALALIDVRLGAPLTTPALLGYGVARVLGLPALADSLIGVVVASTVLHLAACIALATAASAVVRRVRHDADRLAAYLLIVVLAALTLGGIATVLARTVPLMAYVVPRYAMTTVLGWLVLGGWTRYANAARPVTPALTAPRAELRPAR